MKQRRQARLDQQPRRTAKRRPTQRSASAARSHSHRVSAAYSSSASAFSPQVRSERPVISPLPVLQRVGPDVLILILQCLSARHKLAAISRLSRVFYPLPPLAFLHDSAVTALKGVPGVQVRKERTNAEQHRLALFVYRPEEPSRSLLLFSCPRSLRSLPCMSSLQQLLITVCDTDYEDWSPSLPCILRSVLSLPCLTELSIGFNSDKKTEVDWVDSALPSPVSLRRLELYRLLLSAASVRRICGLPVESLYLHDCRLLPGGDNAPFNATELSGSGLVELRWAWDFSHQMLSIFASHAQLLRSLNLDQCRVAEGSGQAWDLSCLMSASGAPRLPHLTELLLPDPSKIGDEWGRPDLEDTWLFSTTSLQLVAAYSAQLTSLSVTVLIGSSIGDWLRIVCGRCCRLERLCILGCSLCGATLDEQPLQAARAIRLLPSLRYLYIRGLPMTDGSLLALLSHCPELTSCRLRMLQDVTKAGTEAAFRSCPKLIYAD